MTDYSAKGPEDQSPRAFWGEQQDPPIPLGELSARVESGMMTIEKT